MSFGLPANAALESVAEDFGIHAMTLSKWMRQASIDAGEKFRRHHGGRKGDS